MEPTIYWIDLFCGAGGTTTGIHLANANAKVIACVNHDKNAIYSHKSNYSNCLHLNEDIRDFKVVQNLKKLVDSLRAKDPECIINLWASLECTNFSNAKGGLPRDADSRTLAEHLFMYLDELSPDYLYIENVREFMAWGELDHKGKPVSRKKGGNYIRWVNNIQNYGYKYEYKLLNAADFGAYTSRLRYFGQFAKNDLPISWPEATHVKKLLDDNSLFSCKLRKWKPVKDILNLSEQGNSIFGNTKAGKPYSDNTLNRVYEGLKKFVPTEANFLTSYYGNGGAHSVNMPCNTLTTKDRYALHFIHYDYSTITNGSIDSPAGTITTSPKHNLVSVQWTFDTQYTNKGRSIERPGQTLIARMDKKPIYLVSAIIEGKVDQRINQPNDSGIRLKIRAFLREHNIIDVKIRSLFLDELLKIQGFPDEYILKGTKTEKLKFVGNSVAPVMAQKLAESNYNSIKSMVKKSA